jgi:tRNA(Ile)-lysidine synthase
LTVPEIVARQLRDAGQHSRVVVAVSGGPDSVALLRAIVSQHVYPSIIVAHLNHRLRGRESDEDEEFVRQLTGNLAESSPATIQFITRHVDVLSQAKNRRQNLEAAARQERYRFLREVAQAHQAHLIVTGHTADDQAETVLLRLIRGCGLRGLRGILPRRQLAPQLELRRPLLRITRAQILDYLHSLGQHYRNDSSNRDLRLARNRIRAHILPLLRDQFNPKVTTHLVLLADQARRQYHLLRRIARNILRSCEMPPAGPLRILDASRLQAAPELEGCEALRLLWRREKWPVDRIGQKGWQRLWQVVLGERSALDLPGGIHARRRGHVLQIGPRSPT